uniref:RRM domain-containing protein n=1 Tax=Meloidogyne enterolobii TaxID=390850 RepID=A0A6V7WEE7_MELEN|nr:unnamed protein product [Meloidogyne enterolobii]
MSNRRSRGGFVEGKVYVGGLPEDATSEEIDDAFHKFGRIRKIWVARRPPGFAFVEFDDHRDAEDAVRALDGTRICGVKARVELSTSSSGRGDSGRTYSSVVGEEVEDTRIDLVIVLGLTLPSLPPFMFFQPTHHFPTFFIQKMTNSAQHLQMPDKVK